MRILSPASVLAGPLPPVRWLIRGLIAEGEQAVFYGEYGTMKSLLLTHLAYHLATGRDWLGHQVASPRRVLYLDGEMGEDMAHRRLWQIGQGAGMPREVPLRYVVKSHFRAEIPASSSGLLQRVRLADGFDPQVVIVDTMRATMVGDENSSTEVTGYFHALHPFSDQGRTLILAHHMGKPPDDDSSQRSRIRYRARGSSRIMDHVDAAFGITKAADGVAVVQPVKARNSQEAQPFGFELQGSEDSPLRLDRVGVLANDPVGLPYVGRVNST